MNITHKENA